MYVWTSLVTVLCLILYLVLTINVGRTRSKYNIKPPAMTGDPNFERVLRVHQNTLEQLVFFLPLLWLFSFYISPLWGAGLGTLWLVARIIYAWGYYREARMRLPGFALSSLISMVLLAGSLIGIILSIYSVSI